MEEEREDRYCDFQSITKYGWLGLSSAFLYYVGGKEMTMDVPVWCIKVNTKICFILKVPLCRFKIALLLGWLSIPSIMSTAL